MLIINQNFVDCPEGFQCDGNYCFKRHCKKHKDCPNDQRCNRAHICDPIPCRYVKFEKNILKILSMLDYYLKNLFYSTIFHLHDSTVQRKTVLDLYFVRAGKYILTIKVIPYHY